MAKEGNAPQLANKAWNGLNGMEWHKAGPMTKGKESTIPRRHGSTGPPRYTGMTRKGSLVDNGWQLDPVGKNI